MYNDPPLVDSHAHIFTERLPLIPTAWARLDYDMSVERYLKILDDNDVPFGVVTATSLYGDLNDYLLEAVRAHRRLRGTVIVKPDISPYELRAMRDDGIVGVRLSWKSFKTLPDIDSYEYRRLLMRIADLGMHVHLLLDGARIPAVMPALEASGARVVIDHFGNPNVAAGMNDPGFQAILRSLDTGRIWVKVSGSFHFGDPAGPKAWTQKLLETCGAERLIWGSDSPFVGSEGKVTYPDVLKHYYDMVPDPAIRRQIAQTSLAFYFF
jgi:predicted TIM-barrel fold metal-dependent hydrolase